jgi:hypothetical protein
MAVVAEEVDMGQKQEMANLNSLTAGGFQEPVSVSLLYLYFKLVVVDKDVLFLWKTGFLCSWTVTCSICKGVGLSAFDLYRRHEQVPRVVESCG